MKARRKPINVEESASDTDFMLSQNLRTYQGKTICNSVSKSEKSTVITKSHGDALYGVLSPLTQGKFKKIHVNIEILNNSDSE